MEKQSELYFTTEEFARVLGVGRHTLFRYDEASLFPPAPKEENGYRYYFVWQMDMLKVIRTLQKLGMPLGEIKEYMEDRSPERLIPMIDGKKRQAGEEIRRPRNMKRFALHEEESVQLAVKAALDEPGLVERDREYLLMPDISTGPERRTAVEIAKHVRMQEKYHDTVSAVESIYLGGNMNQGIYDRYVKVYIRLDKKTASRRVQSRPGRTYVELYGRGHLWGMEKPYHLTSAFVGERGIRLGQMWYGDLILGELTVKEYEQYIVKVMVPMESRVVNP